MVSQEPRSNNSIAQTRPLKPVNKIYLQQPKKERMISFFFSKYAHDVDLALSSTQIKWTTKSGGG